jgi:hypothetical protein
MVGRRKLIITNMNINSTSCCAVVELDDIRDGHTPKAMISNLANYYYSNHYFKYVIFTDINDSYYARPLEAAVKKLKLGTVIKTRGNKNPNSKNKVTVYVWAVNITNLLKHADDTDYED